jgi:hypothetical protein
MSPVRSLYTWTQMDPKFRIKQLVVGRIHKITSPKDFIDVFFNVGDREHNLLCELYLFNFLLHNHLRWNHNPFVWHVQLRVFSSFIYGFIQWKDSNEFYA